MIIFLYGADIYRLNQKKQEIEQEYRQKNKGILNLEKIDGQAADFLSFWDSLNQRSMFVKKKLFFLENIFSSDEFKKDFAKKIKHINQSQDIIVLIEKQAIKKSDSFFKLLVKSAKTQHFELLTGLKLRTWAQKECEKLGLSISPPCLQALLDFAKSDLFLISNEIKKLACLGEPITKEKITALFEEKLETEIFKTIDCLAQRDRKTALRLLQAHIEKGDSPFYLLSMIVYQLRGLLLVKSAQGNYAAPSQLGLHPFVFRKLNNLAHQFSFSELQKLFHLAFETDYKIKTGKIMPEQGLQNLILSF